MCSIQAKIRGEDTERQEGTPPPPRCSPLHGRPHAWCTPTRPAPSGQRAASGTRRQRRGALLAARPVCAASEAVPLAAAGPGAAPCAGGAWTAGALVRGSGRHCAGRETAPARAWRELDVSAWCALSACAPRLEAPSGSGAQGRERRAALSSVAISPRGVSRWRASSKTRSPSEAGNAAIACVSARPAERPRQLAGLPAPALLGCQPVLKRVRGSAPHNPGRRSPSRVGVGGEVEGPHCGAVQDRRAARGSLA